jgi:ribosomal protein S18 acetylase RimI-like enzyme
MSWTDADLYDRMVATLIASWERVAEGSADASVARVEGATAGLFPAGPERGIYNNAVLERGLNESEAAEAVGAIGRLYADAGVDRYAVWAHDSETASIAELAGRGFKIDTWTRAMAMPLDEMDAQPPRIDLRPSEWAEHLRYLQTMGVPDGVLEGVDGNAFHVLVARLDGENVATAIAYDHDGDCGIFNMGTLPSARRRGLGTALATHHAHAARERGCETASLQSTEIAERVYARVGFRDLGRFVEYVPKRPPGRSH